MVTKKLLIDAVAKVAEGFVAGPNRWSVKVVHDLFADLFATDTGIGNDPVVATAPEFLKEVVESLFLSLADMVGPRPFLKRVVAAVGQFVVNNLLDAVWDELFNKGERTAAGAVPMMYTPANVAGLEAELAAACSGPVVGDEAVTV